MTTKINFNEEKLPIQLPKSLRELRIYLNSEEGVHQLIRGIASERIAAKENKRYSWSEQEPLCLRELVQAVIFEDRLRSAIAPLFAASQNDPFFQESLFKVLSLSETKEGTHLNDTIDCFAKQPEMFFNLCKKAFQSKNYQLLFQLTQYCAEHPDFAESCGKEIDRLAQDIVCGKDSIAFGDLLDKNLDRFYYFSLAWLGTGLNINRLFSVNHEYAELFIKKRGTLGQKVERSSLENFGKNNSEPQPEGWNQIRLAIANGADVDPPPKLSPYYYISEQEKKAQPFKEEAYLLACLRKRLYTEGPLSYLEWLDESELENVNEYLTQDKAIQTRIKYNSDFKPPLLKKDELIPFLHLQKKLSGNEPFHDLEWLKESERNCLYSWLNFDKEAATVIKKYPDFFKTLLRVAPFQAIDFSAVLTKYREAGCFNPIEDGKLLFKAIDHADAKALVAFKRAGVSLNQIDPDTGLTPFQYALTIYLRDLKSYDPQSFQESNLRSVLEILIDSAETDCNQPCPNGKHPIEVLLGSDLEMIASEEFRKTDKPRLSKEKRELLKKMLSRGADLRYCRHLSLMKMITTMVPQDVPVLNILVSHKIALDERDEDSQESILHALLGQCPSSPLRSDWIKLFNTIISQDPKRFASLKDYQGNTPLDVAIASNHSGLVLLLLQWGVVPEGFFLNNLNLDRLDPQIRTIVSTYVRKPLPTSPEELVPWLTLKNLGNFFGDVILKEQRSAKGKGGGGPLTGQATGTALEFLSAALSAIQGDISEHEKEKLQGVQTSLKKVIRISLLLDACSGDPLFRAQHLPVICSVVRSQIEMLAPGESLLLPSGWLGLEGTGHTMLVEVQRNQNGLFSLKVVNTGSGIEKHAQRQSPLKTRFNSVRHFDGVTGRQLLHTEFIESLLTLDTYLPADGANRYTEKDIYHLLFSRFERNAAPLDEEKTGHFRTAQRSGTCSMRTGLAYLQDALGVESYKKIKIEADHAVFKALSLSNLVRKLQFDPVFARLLEHTICKTALNLHKNQQHTSPQAVEALAGLIENVHGDVELAEEMKLLQQENVHSLPPAEAFSWIDQDPAQKIITSIDVARSQLTSVEEDAPMAVEPSPYLAPPYVDFSHFSSGKQWIEAFEQLVDFFDASGTTRSDPLRSVAMHLTTGAIGTLPLPIAGIFNPEIDTNHLLGSLSSEDKAKVAERIKGLAQRYATAFYHQRQKKENKWAGEPELVEQYVCLNKLYATYWRLMLHLEKAGEDNVSLQGYGLDISHLKALQNSPHLPTYSPQVATQLAEVIAFFETSHPDQGNAKKTLLSISSWKSFQPLWSTSYNLSLPLEGDLGEVDLFNRYYDKIPSENWDGVELNRDLSSRGGWDKPDQKQWRLAHLFVDPATYTKSHLAIYQSLREMALICWSFKGVSQEKFVTFASPEWSGEHKRISTRYQCEVGFDDHFTDIAAKAKTPSRIGKHGWYRSDEALEETVAQNDYMINKRPDSQRFYDIAHSEIFALDRLLSYYEDHPTLLSQIEDRCFFQALLFGKDRLKKGVERDPMIMNRLLNIMEQALCEFELQLGMSPAREDLFTTVMFFKALKLRVAEYFEEMEQKPSLTSQEAGADLQQWIERQQINTSDLHLLWIYAQPESAWKDPKTCLEALVHLAQAEQLENQKSGHTREHYIWKAWVTRKFYSHAKLIQETAAQDKQLLMAAGQRIASLYGIPTENVNIEGSFPQVILRDEQHLYELNLLSGIVIRDQISLTNPKSHSFGDRDEIYCFQGRKEKSALYPISSHKEENLHRSRFYVSSGGNHYFITNSVTHFQNKPSESHKQILWERAGESFVYTSFDAIPKEWKEIPLPHLPKKTHYCYWMNTQDAPICAVIEHTATSQEEIVIYRDGSIERLGKPGRWRLVDLEHVKESRSLKKLQAKNQTAFWEMIGDCSSCEEIQCFGLIDKEGAPFIFSREEKEGRFQCNNLPDHHLAQAQTIKGLGNHFPYAVLENDKGEKKAIIPMRGWSETAPFPQTKNHSSPPAKEQEEEKEKRYAVEIIPVDSHEQLSVLSVRQKLFLAYNFLGAKQYERALKFLSSSATSSLYTPEELQIFAWIFLHSQETRDYSPRAKALSLLAAHLVRQNLKTFPDAYNVAKDAKPITDLYAPPSAWVEFWKGNVTQYSGKKEEQPETLWESLTSLLVSYYDVSSHCSGDFHIFERYSSPFQEAEWLQEVIEHVSDPQLFHRLQYLVSPQTPDSINMAPIMVIDAPKIVFDKKDFRWSFKAESITVNLLPEVPPLTPIFHELNRVRPESKFKDYFSQLFCVARKGTEDEKQKLLRFLRDMRYDPSDTNQILRAILLSQLPPYNTYEYTDGFIFKKISEGIAETIETIAKNPNYERYGSPKEDGDLLTSLEKWRSHYFPIPSSQLEKWRSHYFPIPSSKLTQNQKNTLPDIAALIPPASKQKTNTLPSPQFGELDPSISELNSLAPQYFHSHVNETAPISYPPLPENMAKDPYFQMRAEMLRDDIAHGASLNANQVIYSLKKDVDVDALKTSLISKRNTLREERKALKSQLKLLVSKVSGGPQEKLNAQLLRLGKKDIPPELDECIALFVQADLSLYRKRLPFLSEDDCRSLHGCIGKFLQKTTEEQRWERCIQHLAITDSEDAIQAVALEMTQNRKYDPSQYPQFMVFEYYAGFALRKEQVDNLIQMTTVDANGNYPPRLLQMIMSAGKTSVLGTLLALMKADGYHLSILLTPKSALETNALEMKERNSRFFGQRGDVITFNRGSAYFNVPHLRRLYNQLVETINHRRYVIMVPETLLSMQNQYTEAQEKIRALKAKQGLSLVEQKKNAAEIQRLQAALQELKKVLHLIESRGAKTKDEIDTLHAARKELNYPGVNIEHLDRISIDLAGKLYEIASCDPEIKKIGMNLHANTQSRLLPDQIEKIKQLLGYKMVDAIIANPIWCQHLGIPLPCDPEKIVDLQNYFSNPEYTAPEWISKLHHSSTESVKMGAERLTLVRQEILKWLPSCWKLSASEHFSRSKEDPSYLAAKPNISANTPHESAEIAHAWELVNKTLQLYICCGADPSQAKIIIQSLQKLAVIQRNKIKVDSQADPQTVIEQTEAARLFSRLVEGKERLMQIDANDSATMERMHKLLNSSKPEAFSLIIQYLTDHVFPELEFHTDQIDNNAMNLNGQDDQGYSGTVGNLYLFDHQFTQHPQETVILDRGAYGKVIDIMCRLNKTVHGVSSQLKTPYALMQAIHATKPAEEQNAFKALIDIGAFFKGQTNLEIARSFLNYFSELGHSPIQGILYYDDATNQLACLKKGEEGKPIIIGPTDGKSIYAATSLSPDQLFTFYDQFHTTGANIIQPTDAQGFYTVGDQTLRDDLQGMMRMRGLLGGKQRLEGIVPQDLIPLIAHHIEQPIEGVPTIEQLFLFGEVNGLHQDAEDNVKVFLVKLQAAVRKYVRSHSYASDDPAEEEAFYETIRQFFIRSVQEELFLQYGGVPEKIKKKQYIADRLDIYLTALENITPFLPQQQVISLEQELRGIAAVAESYLPLEIDQHSSNDKITVEKVVESKTEKLTEQEVQTQTGGLNSQDKPQPAKERGWDFSSVSALMQQLWSFKTPSLLEKPLIKRLSDVMLSQGDLSLFSDCFTQNVLISTNFLETASDHENLCDKLQKRPLEALIFFDQDKTPHLLLLSSKEAESFAQFIEKKKVPLTLLNPKADLIPGTHPIDEQNLDIEQLRIQMLFFSGRLSSLEQDRWQQGLDAYLVTKRGLKRDLFEGILLSSDQIQSYQNSGLELKLNAPSNLDNEPSSSIAVLKKARFLFNQKRVAECQALVDEHISAIKDPAEIGQLIDLAMLNAGKAPADWAFSLFQKIFPLVVGQKGLIDKLIIALARPMEQRIKQEIVDFILHQPGLSDHQLALTVQNAISFQVDHEVQQHSIVEKFEQMISFLETFSDQEKMIPYVSLIFSQLKLKDLSYDPRLRQTCFNILEAIVEIIRRSDFSKDQKHLLCAVAAPHLATYFEYIHRERLSAQLRNSQEPHVNEIYDKLSDYYGHFQELDQLLEKGLIQPLTSDSVSRYSWADQYKILSQVNIPYVQERAKNLKLRFDSNA